MSVASEKSMLPEDLEIENITVTEQKVDVDEK